MKTIALFPLNLVAFPGEEVNLHVFEPRYKQLINDCLDEDNTFGIPSYVNNRIDLGTEVEITEVTKKYDDGRMDIRTQAISVFKVTDYWNPWGEKLYAGGEVTPLPVEQSRTDLLLLLKLKELTSQLFTWLDATNNFKDISRIQSVFEIGHKLGFKLEEEYQLLAMPSENDRLSYTIRHLERFIPALERAHSANERIKQNGHFKHLDPLEF